MPRTWFITGCSRGLGRALAEAVLASGDRLAATARDPNALADLVSCAGDRVIALPLDVTDEAAAERAVSAAADRFGGLDVVVNNAGYGNVAPIENTSIAAFRAQIETNLFGTIIVTKAAIPLFRAQRGGRFIQFSSIGGRAGATGRAPYSAAKFGVEGFCEVLAVEMAPFGVHVTIVEPGGFRTDFAGSSTHIDEGKPPMPRPSARPPRCSGTSTASSLAIPSARLMPSSRCRRWTDLHCGWCSAAMPMRARNRPTRPGLPSCAHGARPASRPTFPPHETETSRSNSRPNFPRRFLLEC
jgi:NAD(P)-dependent dehydrogenase (short-subunit alcohol dehydrogenase family)